MITRISSAVAILTSALLGTLSSNSSWNDIVYILMYFMASSFFFLSISSALFACGKFQSTALPSLLAIFHCVVIVLLVLQGLEIARDAIFPLWSFRDTDFQDTWYMIVPVLLYFIETILIQSLLRLRYRYALFACLFNIILLIMSPYPKFIAASPSTRGEVFGVSLGYFILTLMFALSVVAVSRINYC